MGVKSIRRTVITVLELFIIGEVRIVKTATKVFNANESKGVSIMKTKKQPILAGCILLIILNATNILGDDMILRYLPDDPEISPMLQCRAEDIPDKKAILAAQNLTLGPWEGVPHDRYSTTGIKGNPDVNWRLVRFTKDDMVHIQYELLRNREIRNFTGTYKIIFNPLKHGRFPEVFNIVVRSLNPTEKKIGVLAAVSIREANVLTPYGLWFEFPKGYSCVFYPGTREMAETLEEIRRKEREEQIRAQEDLNRAALRSRLERQHRITDPELTKRIIDGLKNGKLTEEDQNHRILDLMNKGDATAVPILLEHMKAGHSLVIRQNAIRALGKIGDKTAVPALLAFLSTPVGGDITDEAEDNAILRRNAVIALGNIGDPSSLPVLKAMVQSKKEYQSVRELAVTTIRKLEEKKVVIGDTFSHTTNSIGGGKGVK